MKSAHSQTCPRCNGRGARCTGCGAFYPYGSPIACLGTTCRATGAAAVCRCGRVHEPQA